ncbi:MAG: 50S ribosomal protein L35ae [Nanoarchaeota archaeon]|nr:50S ribosomal protein L35ae [Nanoarchaeota archaeon]
MEGVIANFRRGRKTVYTNQMIVEVDGVGDREKARGLVGKKILWISEGKNKKEFIGEIRGAHGNKGAVRVKFEKGMPGQAVGQKVEVVNK